MDSRSSSMLKGGMHDPSDVPRLYEKRDRIGAGGYSTVYRALRRSDGLTVALKKVRDYKSAAREVDALLALRGNPNIVRLLDYYLPPDPKQTYGNPSCCVLILEFLPETLESVIVRAKKKMQQDGGGGVGGAEFRSWMVQLLRGVEAIHSHGFVHRDLKPSNMLISPQGVLKVADFGQARRTQEDDDSSSSNDASRWSLIQEDDDEDHHGSSSSSSSSSSSCGDTDSKNVMTCCAGTQFYMAPEILFDTKNYGIEVDLWSLGCVGAELLTLSPLFPAASSCVQIRKIVSVLGDLDEATWPGCSQLPSYFMACTSVEDPIGLEACLPNRSPGEVGLVKRLLCYHPPSRATATELLHDHSFFHEGDSLTVDDFSDEHYTDHEEEDGSSADHLQYYLRDCMDAADHKEEEEEGSSADHLQFYLGDCMDDADHMEEKVEEYCCRRLDFDDLE